MGFRFKYDASQKPLIRALPGASTARGMISSSDIGKLLMASSNHGVLAVGTTEDKGKLTGIIGIIAAVPDASTADSTTPVYVQPILPGEVIEADYSTSVAGTTSALTLTSNIGSYFGWSNTTTVAGGATIDPSTCGKAPGTTSGFFLKMLGFDNTRKTIYGVIDSSHLAL